MKKTKLIITVIVVILMLIVVLQNTQAVETNLLFYTFSLPNALLLALTFASGIVVGLLMSFTYSGKKPKK
ncbi:MAG: LapA family protein [Planctomicrobium sp.]|jgi:uncharacterized integral membrane protein|nr:LapA family protein [Planctomicrobium sp.]